MFIGSKLGITFDKNDSESVGIMPNQIIACDSTVNLNATNFMKTGWSFAGWATTTDGSIVYIDQESFTMGSADITLYALMQIYYNATLSSQCFCP